MKTLDELIENINHIVHSNKIVLGAVWILTILIGLISIGIGNPLMCLLTALSIYVLSEKY